MCVKKDVESSFYITLCGLTTMKKTFSFRASGLVQGVFFRQSAQRQAGLLNITGWVRNLPDGRVEGQATGDAALLDTFRRWLKRGPVAATVLKLEWEETELQQFDGFRIR